MSFIIRPAGSADLADAALYPDGTLPADIELRSGQYELGRIAWSEDIATIEADVPVFQALLVDDRIEFETFDWSGLFGVRIVEKGVSLGTVYQTVEGAALHTDLLDLNGVEQKGVLISTPVLSLVEDLDDSGTPTEQDRLSVSRVIALSKTVPTILYRFFVGNEFHSNVEPGVKFDVPAGAAEQGTHVKVTVENSAGVSDPVESNYLPIEKTPEPEGFTITEVATLRFSDATVSSSALTWDLPSLEEGDYYATISMSANSSRDINGLTIKGQEMGLAVGNGKTAARDSIGQTRAEVRRKLGLSAGGGAVSLALSSTTDIHGSTAIQLYRVNGVHHVLDVNASLLSNGSAGYNFVNKIMTADGGALIGAAANIANAPDTYIGVTEHDGLRNFRLMSTTANSAYAFSMSNSENLNTSRLIQAAITLAPGDLS
ncbi:hypothetical protein [Palleronia sp. LCG004]|uniref:hypothetical protein n=1 Tax=Palleronia sp. LCG004 TaxID=3079304 RepID=UPI00294209A0|nr:hypothetical protein [Palleronia sp. LCG004]WOI54942.1 hypothetical protein RVY76_07645 [Palleronia sp. LCG004]